MNPWLEEFWRDVHASFLVYARDQLNEELPPGLQARIDERLAIDAETSQSKAYIPDVAVTEPWDQPKALVTPQGRTPAVVAEPIIVDSGQEVIRHVEIVDSKSHVITALELLSPSNKADAEACHQWKRKRLDYLAAGIHLVEIDLLRGGLWALPDRSLLKSPPAGRQTHYVCVTRTPWAGKHEFYLFPLRERLPAIRVPLRAADPDVALDVQSLLDPCYDGGRYGAV